MIELQSLVDFFQAYGYVMVFTVLLLCGFGLPVPEDISLVAGGIISGLGYTNVHVMLFIGMAGVLIGDGTVYNLGRLFGERVFRKKMLGTIISEERYQSIQRWFKSYGKAVIFAARFMPGLRTPIFATAGITRFVSFPVFIAIDGLAALLSVPFWIYLGYFGASRREELVHWLTRSHIGIGVALLVFIVFLLVKMLVKRTLRRRTGMDE